MKDRPKKIVWVSEMPMCDLCKKIGVSKEGKFDVKTVWGPWANLCRKHLQEFGTDLSIGFERVKEVQS